MRAEIPVGWHTGKHLHGEEAIYVESGEGFMVLDDKRYDFFPGTVLHIPYRSKHQLFNTGNAPVGYLSGLAWHLEAEIVARTTRRSHLLSRRKSPSTGLKTAGGSPCIRNSMRNPTSRSTGRPIF